MDKIFDVAVVGGGVIGANIFSDLCLSGVKAVLIEKGLDVAVGASKANSAIIHAGFDAKPNTLKALFNVKGHSMFPQLCDRLGVKLKQIGSYVVGADEQSIAGLLEKGKLNGVKGLKVLNRTQLKRALPNVADEITIALKAPTSYIVDPYLLTICLAEEGVVNGGQVELNFNAKKITKHNNVFVINGEKTIYAKNIVNAAGAGYNDVAKLIGSETYDIKFRRGEYYVLDHSEANIVPSTIFPLPTKAGKGVLVTPTVDGNILVGPTSYESDSSTITTQQGLADIKQKVGAMLTNVNLSKAIRVFSGVRCIVGDDFVIEKSKKKQGVINIAGICSPGLSSAPAISQYVVENLLNINYHSVQNPKKIKPYVKISELDNKSFNKLVKSNPDYGKIICKCEGVSLGEIKDAINRPIRPTTIDAIKRRVRAGMGRCQGGFCADKVALILAKENKVDILDVKREHPQGNYLKGGKL